MLPLIFFNIVRPIQLIKQFMDSRIYFHQYRRPRYSNPTYLSSNVQNSMTFFSSNYNNDKIDKDNRPQKRNSYFEDAPYQITPQQRYSSIRVDNNGSKDAYPSMPRQKQRNASNLSNYGSNTLSLNQKDVHNKQTSKFDIISLKPRQYSSQIKQYPWLTVENRDDIYYKRMNEIYSQKNENSYYQEKRKGNNQEVIAGKHTYDLEPKISYNPEGRDSQNKNFTPKMLNHMDELSHLA